MNFQINQFCNSVNQMFVTFNRGASIDDKPDLGEKIGKIGLGLLHIGFGKHISVESFSKCTQKFSFKKTVYTLAWKVSALVLFIFAYRFFVPLAVIGCLGTLYSTSRQKIFRLYTERADLPGELFQKAVNLLNNQNSWGEMPKASSGKTRVYLPNELPEVVLKESGGKSTQRRKQMDQVRVILEEQGSENLIIPLARQHENYLIEERLPIHADCYHNMDLYQSNPRLFDDAVREMTRLFSKVYLSDLVVFSIHPLGNLEGVENQVRYDNLPLYIVEENGEKKGKIGLIDLEHLDEQPSPEGLETLVRIFPNHLDLIKEEAKKLRMEIDDSKLDAAAIKGKKYLQLGYLDHLAWLEKKKITSENAFQSFEISIERQKEIAQVIEKELEILNEGVNNISKGKRDVEQPKKGFLDGKINQKFALNIVDTVIKNMQQQIKEKQDEILNKTKQKKTFTSTELVNFRSPQCSREELYNSITQFLKSPGQCYAGEDAADQLVCIIGKELAKGGELFSFDPAFYTYAHNRCWIRY